MPTLKTLSTEIRVDPGTGHLVVDNFDTADPDVVMYFEEVPASERHSRFEAVLRIGVVAMRTVGTTDRVDFVEKRFNALRESFESKLQDIFGKNGEMKRTVETYFGERGLLPETIKDAFGEKGSFSRLLEIHFGPEGKIVKELFDPSTPGTPLAKLRLEFERQLVELRRDLGLAEQAEAMAKSTPIKGRQFEEEVDEMLSNIARPLGDIVERTSDKPGLLKGSKKGDFTLTVSDRPDIKLVFETKDMSSISMPAIESEMKEALENRGATFGVFVSKNVDSLPRSVGWFNEYGGKFLVLALGQGTGSELEEEMLRVGYKWARTRSLMAQASISEGVNATLIQAKLDETRRALKRFGQVRSQCTNAKNAVDAILQELGEIQSAIEGNLDSITKEVAKPAR